MDIQGVHDIIHKIAEGFEKNALECLGEQSDVVVKAIREQLMSGRGGDGDLLSPTYINDPYFHEHEWRRTDKTTGKKYHGAEGYRDWKQDITPPKGSEMLGLPPRPEDVPNLFIEGKFHNEINASMADGFLTVDPGNGDGPDIVKKYSRHQILNMGPTAVEYFNREYMWPAIEKFFNDCGYR